MIKVYLFVTGLFLFLEPAGDGALKVAFVAGDREIGKLGPVAKHVTEMAWGENGEAAIPQPFRLAIGQRCDGKCAAPAELEGGKFLADFGLLAQGSKPRSECFDRAEFETKCGDADKTPVVAGVLELSGEWAPAARLDCLGAYPQDPERSIQMGYVDASNATNKLDLRGVKLHLTNSLVFETTVDSTEELELVGNWPHGVLTVVEDRDFCAEQPGFLASRAEACVLIALRHGPEDGRAGAPPAEGQSARRSPPPTAPPGDRHFAALSQLLTPPPETIWLPYRIQGSVCDAGGGTAGLQRCIGGRVKASE